VLSRPPSRQVLTVCCIAMSTAWNHREHCCYCCVFVWMCLLSCCIAMDIHVTIFIYIKNVDLHVFRQHKTISATIIVTQILCLFSSVSTATKEIFLIRNPFPSHNPSNFTKWNKVCWLCKTRMSEFLHDLNTIFHSSTRKSIIL
jgi:hypothetical protein